MRTRTTSLRAVRAAAILAVSACLVVLLTRGSLSPAAAKLAATAIRRAPGRLSSFRNSARAFQRSERSVVSCAGMPGMEDENREAYKQVIKEYVRDGIGSESVAAWKNDINEMLYRLETLNPTEEPAFSKLLEGDWEFKFVGSMAKGILESPTREIALLLYAGGYTPGRFSLDIASRLPKNVVEIKSLALSIKPQAPTGMVKATFKLPGERDAEISLTTNVEPESDFTMSETYKSLTVAGRSFELPSQLQSKRRFYIRYLDDDLLVVRDDTGVADVLTKIAVPVEEVAAPSAEQSEDSMMTFEDTPVVEPEVKEE